MLEDHYFDKDNLFNTFDFLRAMLVNNRVQKRNVHIGVMYTYWGPKE